MRVVACRIRSRQAVVFWRFRYQGVQIARASVESATMYVILPLCDIPSPTKTERVSDFPIPMKSCGSCADCLLLCFCTFEQVLELLSKVGAFTYKNEPQCHAYAWLRNAQDNDVVPHHWLRGIEV